MPIVSGCAASGPARAVDPAVAARIAGRELPVQPDLPGHLREPCPAPDLDRAADWRALGGRYEIAIADCEGRRAEAVALYDAGRAGYGGAVERRDAALRGAGD